jgi:proteasome lid subunit RPN8/RPN11
MKVLVPPAVTREFYRRARAAYPNEIYGILLGTESTTEFRVSQIYYPPEQNLRPSPDLINVDYSWFTRAAAVATGLDLEILGDIHSHCYDEHLDFLPGLDPSESDWDWQNQIRRDTAGRYRLMGIVRCLKKKDGRLDCATRFWPAVELPTTAPWQQRSTSKRRRRS